MLNITIKNIKVSPQNFIFKGKDFFTYYIFTSTDNIEFDNENIFYILSPVI